MATSFDEIFEIFKEKITDYDLAKLIEGQVSRIFDIYLGSACSYFHRKFPLVDLTRDKENRTFISSLDDDIIEILAIGMVYYWASPKAFATDNITNIMQTKDFTDYSPANLLKALLAARDGAKREFRIAVIDYTYMPGKG